MRELGFYWVKYGEEWTLGEFDDRGCWSIISYEFDFHDEEFSCIGPRISPPEDVV